MIEARESERCAPESNVIDTTVRAIQDEIPGHLIQTIRAGWLLYQDRRAYADRVTVRHISRGYDHILGKRR